MCRVWFRITGGVRPSLGRQSLNNPKRISREFLPRCYGGGGGRRSDILLVPSHPTPWYSNRLPHSCHARAMDQRRRYGGRELIKAHITSDGGFFFFLIKPLLGMARRSQSRCIDPAVALLLLPSCTSCTLRVQDEYDQPLILSWVLYRARYRVLAVLYSTMYKHCDRRWGE